MKNQNLEAKWFSVFIEDSFQSGFLNGVEQHWTSIQLYAFWLFKRTMSYVSEKQNTPMLHISEINLFSTQEGSVGEK